MLDNDFLSRKIKLIQEDLSLLEELGVYSFDINQHLIAELGKGNERVRGYEDTFYVLSGLGIYSEKFAKTIAPSAGLRNRLVHEYNDTKKEIIYKSVAQAISQYSKYCGYILKFLEKNNKS